MKHILFILFCSLQSLAFSHDYFFAFAEVDYNDITQKFETTIVVSSHDLDLLLAEKDLGVDSLSTMIEGSELFNEINSIVARHFQISSGDQNAKFIFYGAELLRSGVVQIYLESEPIEIGSNITVSFDLLMHKFPEQQNKLTLYYRDNTYTATFMRTTKTNNILLEYD